MKVLEATVDWATPYANAPTIKILFDKMVSHADIQYEREGDFYFGQHQGLVSFYSHNPSDQRGFGGRSFTLQMLNGPKVTIKGPWSSRAGAANRYFKECKCVDVSLTDEKDVWLRGHTFYAGAVTLGVAKTAAKRGRFMLAEICREDGDLVYEPTLIGSPPKDIMGRYERIHSWQLVTNRKIYHEEFIRAFGGRYKYGPRDPEWTKRYNIGFSSPLAFKDDEGRPLQMTGEVDGKVEEERQ